MSDRIDLTELRTLAEAATPGPWAIEPHLCGNSPARSIHVAGQDPDEFPVVAQLGCGCCDVGLDAEAFDLAYIAALNPATVLRLLAAVEAMLDEHPRYEGDFSDFCGHCQTRGEGTWPCPTVTAITTALGADDE